MGVLQTDEILDQAVLVFSLARTAGTQDRNQMF